MHFRFRFVNRIIKDNAIKDYMHIRFRFVNRIGLALMIFFLSFFLSVYVLIHRQTIGFVWNCGLMDIICKKQ